MTIDIRKCENLQLLKQIQDNSIDLIYSDILYGTGRNFEDFKDLKPNRCDIEQHYIPRLKQMHRVLSNQGTIYLHMDFRINHWIRIIMDDIFGYDNFLNQLVQCYNTRGYSKTKWCQKHDNILVYTKTKNYVFNMQQIRQPKPSQSTIDRFLPYTLKHGYVILQPNRRRVQIKNKQQFYKIFKGHPPYSWIVDINPLTGTSKQRQFGKYDTQKPVALIQKIIMASSNEGDLVADFYGGSFTTAVACFNLNRRFIGCDISQKAVQIGRQRINNLLQK